MKGRLHLDHKDVQKMLEAMPEHLGNVAGGLVIAAAESAAAEIRGEYYEHRVTGNLIAGVGFTAQERGIRSKAEVFSRAPHAHLFEYGTEARQFNGASRGSMPAGNVFWPAFEKWERHLAQAIDDLLRAEGLTVRRAA